VSTQIAIRLDDAALAALEEEVRAGRAATRSDAVRAAIAAMQRLRRYARDEAILAALAERGQTPYPDLEPLADPPFAGLD
jgi:Arc/MetJ-type ribon-helix-helix transcriptional regulator